MTLRQGLDFVDKVFVQVSAGKGGDGGVAFHTEKFVPNGPPSGGNGGRGGNVYIRPVAGLSSLASLQKKMRAHNGLPGQGTWMHGKRGKDLIIDVPYGTVVREVRDHSASSSSEDGSAGLTEDVLSETWSDWRRRLKVEELEDPEASRARKARLFVLYPGMKEDTQSAEEDRLADLQLSLLEEERREALARARRPALRLDFDRPPQALKTGIEPEPQDEVEEVGYVSPADAVAEVDPKVLILKGGQGGFGNPYFTSADERRAPKFATRGRPGEAMRIELELKTLADIGLVGFPNAGKSTLLRALTHSKTVVASYAFTTLSPQIGTLIVYDDGSFSTLNTTALIQDSNSPEEDQHSERRDRGERALPKSALARQEKLRLTIADCPGLLPNASDNIGLGHSFLRHIERSRVLIYVVDLSSRSPVEDLRVLREELEAYQAGLSQRARIVVANKADKVNENSAEAVKGMKDKLEQIRELMVHWQAADGMQRTVLPMSAKMRGNVQLLVGSLVGSLSAANQSEASHAREETGQ